MPSLADFQREFMTALRGSPGNDALRDAEPAGLRIHRNTMMKGLVDAVLANYPTVCVLMGAQWTAQVAQAYARQQPARQAVLSAYGESFPEFLGDLAEGHAWPYLSPVAGLDRAWMQSLLAPDAPAIDPEELVTLAPARLASLHLRLHPSAHYGVFRHSAVTIWQANRPPAMPPAQLQVEDEEEAAVLVRNATGVVLLPLDPAALAFLETVVAGGSMTTAVSAALQANSDADIAATWSRFLQLGVFCRI